MLRTYLRPAPVQADGDYAVGHCFACDCGWTRPAAGAYSSVLDLAEYVKFLRAGDPLVLADSWRNAMQQPQIDTEHLVDESHYGYGLTVDLGIYFDPANLAEFRAVKAIWHGGNYTG